MGLDDIDVAAVVEPPLPSMAVPTRDIGKTAMKMLAKILSGEKLDNDRIILQPVLVERRSCAPRQ